MRKGCPRLYCWVRTVPTTAPRSLQQHRQWQNPGELCAYHKTSLSRCGDGCWSAHCRVNYQKFCTNGLQIENFCIEDFECEVAAGVNTLQDVLEGSAEHKRFLMQQRELLHRNRIMRSGIPLWSELDPIHLMHEAYSTARWPRQLRRMRELRRKTCFLCSEWRAGGQEKGTRVGDNDCSRYMYIGPSTADLISHYSRRVGY